MKDKERITALENMLEHERTQTKRLRAENTMLVTANRQISQMTDAILVGMALRYGDKHEEGGELLGYRLPTSKVDVKELLGKWTIGVEAQDNDRVIAVFPKNHEA